MTIRDVAVKVGIIERPVQRILNELVDEGYLVRERVGRANTYRLIHAGQLGHVPPSLLLENARPAARSATNFSATDTPVPTEPSPALRATYRTPSARHFLGGLGTVL